MTTAEPASPASVGYAPGRLPVIGHAWSLRFRPLEFLEAQRDQGDIVVFQIGFKRAYLVNSPELVHQMLTNRNQFVRGGPLFEMVRILCGDGLVNSDGDLHRRQRRLLQPAFQPARFPAYAAIMREAALATTESWKHGQVIPVYQEMSRLTAIVVGRSLYSGRLAAETIEEIIRSIPTALNGIGRRAALPLPWLHGLPTPENRRFNTALSRLHQLTDRLIADYRTNSPEAEDVLSVLLAACDENTGEPMSNQQVHDEVLSLVAAGTETSALVMSWALHLLAGRPDIERKILDELGEVLADRQASHTDLPRLTYLRATVTEVLRLYPPGWLFPRLAAVDAHLGGSIIPAGSYVFFSPYANHHDPLLFPDPSSFAPERWLPSHAKPARGAYIPFGAGVHKCIGDTFGMIEVMISLATILARWRLKAHPRYPIRPRAFTTLSTGRLLMIADRREPRVGKQ